MNYDHFWHYTTGEIGSISRHKITKWIVCFIRELKGLISRSRLFKASHTNMSRPGHCFPRCACSFQSGNPLPEKWPIPLGKPLLHCYKPLVQFLHPLTIHVLPYRLVVLLPLVLAVCCTRLKKSVFVYLKVFGITVSYRLKNGTGNGLKGHSNTHQAQGASIC